MPERRDLYLSGLSMRGLFVWARLTHPVEASDKGRSFFVVNDGAQSRINREGTLLPRATVSEVTAGDRTENPMWD